MNKYDNVNVNMRVNMEDKELVECLTSLKRRKTLLFFLILVINGLICIGANIGLDTFKIIFIFIGVQMAFYGKHTHTHTHTTCKRIPLFKLDFYMVKKYSH